MWKNSTSVMALVCRHWATHIFPDLVVKLVENDLIIRDAVVPENGLGFWARRVHRKPKGGREREEGEGEQSERRLFNKKRHHHRSRAAMETSTGPGPSPMFTPECMSCPSHVLSWQPDL